MTKTRKPHGQTRALKNYAKPVSDPREKDLENAKSQAKAQLESIKEMVAALAEAEHGHRALDHTQFDPEAARERILEDPLSVEVRSDWYSPGQYQNDAHSRPGPTEFRILLCTGGPAVQIVGDLSEYGEPEKARLQYQDWFTPWTDYRLTSEEEETVLTYARCFYFGE